MESDPEEDTIVKYNSMSYKGVNSEKGLVTAVAFRRVSHTLRWIVLLVARIRSKKLNRGADQEPLETS